MSSQQDIDAIPADCSSQTISVNKLTRGAKLIEHKEKIFYNFSQLRLVTHDSDNVTNLPDADNSIYIREHDPTV